MDEVRAVVKWDFIWPGFNIRLEGSHECDTVSEANDLCEVLNDTYGDGTHWVEKLNTTKAEALSE